jgi:aminopeptidase 2
MGVTEDLELVKQTLHFITHKARDQDIVYFFRGLGSNPKTRRALAQFFKDEYDTVSVLCKAQRLRFNHFVAAVQTI